jgi:hypothetical protein
MNRIRRMARACIPGLAIWIFAMILSMVSSAQTTGSITGRITDPSGNVVAGAAVTVTSTGTNVAHLIETNSSGIYEVYDLLVGTYNISVTARGFKSEVKSGVQLNVGDKLAVNFQVTVGNVTETINVTDATPMVNTETQISAIRSVPSR